MSFDFPLGTPFHPYEQLMGVLPFGEQRQHSQRLSLRIPRLFSVIPIFSRLT
jgi:5'-3' exonuclease